MKNDFIVVAFYTLETPYEQEVEKLRSSLLKIPELEYDIVGLMPSTSWAANTAMKPGFIQGMMSKYPTKDILYVDADAVIHKYPEYFDTFDGDIGVHRLRGKEYLTGTIYIKNSTDARRFVNSWVELQSQNPNMRDGTTFHRLIESYENLKFVDTPANYTQIFDLMKDAGEPIIEHFQASRRLVKDVDDKRLDNCPEVIQGIRIRRSSNGTFFLPRAHAAAEKSLDAKYIRIPNELRWYCKAEEAKPLTDLAKYDHCYLVGKGPSLDKLKASEFNDKEAAIICINDSIKKINTFNLPNDVFAIQQDTGLRNTCLPKNGHIIVSNQACGWYSDIGEKYLYYPDNYTLATSDLTVICAIKIMRDLGCTNFTMVSFDACVNKNTEYAKCIGYKSSKCGQPGRFLSHRNKIEHELERCTVNWITPLLPGQSADCTPPPSQHNPVKRHDPVRVEHSADCKASPAPPLSKEPSPRGTLLDHLNKWRSA